MHEKFFFKNGYDEQVAATLSKPENNNGKGVILLHCFTCTKHHRIMRNLSDSLTSKGFTTLRFDFSGSGESQGKIEDATYTKMLAEVKKAISILEEFDIKKIGLAGHSMGAMMSLLCAHEDKRVSALAFIAGSSQSSRVREVFPGDSIEKAEKEGITETFVYGKKIKLKRDFLLDIEKYNVGHAAATLKIPLLIVHGTNDKVIEPYRARELYSWASEPKKLNMMEGADHLFTDDGHLDEMTKEVCGWFDKYL